jgi:hypothetical protein
MNYWAPLSDGIVDSSIWEEPDHVFRVFIGMLSIKGPDHTVRMDTYKLHRRLHMDHALVLDALKILSSPDTKRQGQPHEGRRIAPVDGGWVFLNGEEYRERVSLIMKRARDARAQANYRAKKAGKPLPYPTVRINRQEITPAEIEAHAGVQRAVRRLDDVQRQAGAQAG